MLRYLLLMLYSIFPTEEVAVTTQRNAATTDMQATVFQDWNVGGLAIRTSGITDPTLSVWRGNRRLFAFSPTIAQSAHGSIEIFHEYKPGTTIYPHVHWGQNVAGGGDVVWLIDVEYVNVNSVAQVVGTFTLTSTAQGTQYGATAKQDATGINGVTYALEPGGQFILTITRDATNVADTFAGDAFLLAIGLHFQSDREGTSNMFGPFDT